MKTQFTKKHIGESVVFAGFDGGSYSGTILEVTSETVRVQYFPYAPLYGQAPSPVCVVLPRPEWRRLKLFPKDSKFLVLE